MNRFLLLLLSCLFFSYSPASAVPDTSGMVRFNIENGFPSNNVYSLIKDRNGYLWFATENGVVKYNGYTMKVFNTNDGLPANDVWKLFEDNRGRIWLHSHAYEIGYIENDRYVTALKSDNRDIHADYIASVDSFALFVYKDGENITLFVYGDTVVTNVSLTDICPFLLRTAFIGGDGSLYLIKVGGEIYRYNIFTNRLENKCKFKKDPYPYVSFVNFHRSLNPWVFYGFTFKESTFYKMDMKNCIVSTFDWHNTRRVQNETFYEWYPYNNNLLLITDEAAYIYSAELKLLATKRYKDIIGNLQLSSYRKYNNKEWYTTVSSGVFMSSVQPEIFSKIGYLSNQDLKYVGSVKEKGGLWWNKNTGELVAISYQNRNSYFLPKAYGDVTGFAEDNRAVFMITTAGIYDVSKSFTNAWSIKNLRTIFFYHPFGAEKNTAHISRLSDSLRDGVLLGASKMVGYSEDTFFTNTPYFARRFIFSKDSLAINKVDLNRFSDVLSDRNNNLVWYYNNKKILAYSPRRDIRYYIDDKFLKLLGINSIHRLELDSHAQLYIQDNDKIVVFNIKCRKYKVLMLPVNLSDAHLRLKDDTVLVAGRFGIMYGISRGRLKFSSFRALPNDNFRYYNRLYEFIASDNYLTLNTDKGILQTTTRDLFSVKTAVNASSNDFFRVLIDYPQKHLASNPDTISVMQTRQKPVITFDVINYHGNGDVEYQYRIYGGNYSTGWQKTSSGEVFLGDLSPGTYYKLEYFAKDGLWRSTKQIASLHIIPLWYQTTKWKNIFWITGVVLVFSLIAVTIFLTRYFVARSNEKKQSLVDMELRALYAQINPHFIFNTLGTALFFISKKRIDDAYLHVSKFSKLLRSYLSSSRKRYIILADEIEMLRNYIELQQIRFEEKFNYSIEVDNKVPAHSIQIPTLLLQPLVENAINHGLFHRSSGGLLFIKFLQGKDSSELICIIEDNGVGRQRSKEIKRESVIQYESYGTQLTQELIEIFRKYEDMNIYLEYTDKAGEETGTIVKLTIRNLKYVA